MSKVIIANRVKNILSSVVHYNQTGCVKDRYIGETVPILIFIDFRKTFDTLKWNYPRKCLEVFNFGNDFMQWVKAFYSNIQSCIINNGIASEYFKLECGVRQGHPLSLYLFVLAVETLAIALKKNDEIKGITIEDKETKVLQYADDTTATLSDFNSAKALSNCLIHLALYLA